MIRIDRSTLAVRVADSIYGLIISGKLEPGARLSEHAMGRMFGVSRTPVREALKALAAEGIIDLLPHRGAVVRVAIPERDVRYLMRARAAVWKLTIEAAAERATEEDVWTLRDMVSSMRLALGDEDVERFYSQLDRYYLEIERVAAIPVLSELLHRVQRLGRLIRRMRIGPTTDMTLYVDLAENLLDAIGSHDVERLRDLADRGAERVMQLTTLDGDLPQP
jgi:DNA-binding GntR family transcriptional regulator